MQVWKWFPPTCVSFRRRCGIVSKPELTKQLIANTFKELAEHMPLDKISVQHIVDACKLNRKTFYYHFQDKQALICWIFDSEFTKITDVNHNNTIMDELAEHLYKNKGFYIAALTSEKQNNLSGHLFQVAFDVCSEKIRSYAGERFLAEKDAALIAGMFAHAMSGSITQWAKDGMKTAPREYGDSFYPIIEDCLKYAVNRYFEKRENRESRTLFEP
jgi:probable dihydroxyacetone kinase regulator